MEDTATVVKMDPELKAKWVAALRSGDYAQTDGALKKNDGFCCLGVLCDVMDNTKWGEFSQHEVDAYAYSFESRTDASDLPTTERSALGLNNQYTHKWTGDWEGAEERTVTQEVGTRLIEMNDEDGKTFSEIADFIESTDAF